MGPLPVRLDELPRIDLVLISHNHYDHLDYDTVMALKAQPRGEPLFVVPLGVDLWLKSRAFGASSDSTGGTPAGCWAWTCTLFPRSTGARARRGTATRRCGGLGAEEPDFSFYFAGDTGYSKDFADIGARFGGFRPVGDPCGRVPAALVHEGAAREPEEAVMIHRDVKSRVRSASTGEPSSSPTSRSTSRSASCRWRVASWASRRGLRAVPPRRNRVFQRGI